MALWGLGLRCWAKADGFFGWWWGADVRAITAGHVEDWHAWLATRRIVWQRWGSATSPGQPSDEGISTPIAVAPGRPARAFATEK